MFMKKKLAPHIIAVLSLVVFVVLGLACATAPQSMDPNAVKLEFGGSLPPEVLSYFSENQLADMNAKFVVVQGRVQVEEYGNWSYYNGTILITIGGSYRISQMTEYRKPYKDRNNQLVPGEHIRKDLVYIVPNIGTMYSSLQEARLAAEY